MKRILFCLARYRRQIAAATGVEYALMAAGISLTIMGAVIFFGDSLVQTFSLMFTTLSVYLQEG